MSKTRKRRIDVSDIVGTNIGKFKVIEYKGDKLYKKSSGRSQLIAMYEVECNVCGKRYIKQRQAIKQCGCRNCASVKARDLWGGGYDGNIKEILFKKAVNFLEADEEMSTDYTRYGKQITLSIIAEVQLEKEFKEYYEESKSK